MSSLVGERIPLKKSGRNLKGLCPFHNEKTPSFMVSDEKQIFHCFGCGVGGDAFSFVMKYEGLAFAEAVKALADRCGVTIPEEELRGTPQDADQVRQKKLMLRVNALAAEWFARRLTDEGIGEQIRKYLISRGIKSEIWTQLNLGAADKRWDALCGHLTDRGVPLALAAELGLIRRRPSGDGYYDFFRGRLIFPIFSPRGEIVAFGGRVLEGDDEAKYLNSPDSMIFHKSMSVYGLNWAAEHIRRNDQVMIVEGYMDVIGLMQSGIRNVVAPLGTALTSGHIRLLARTTKNMVLIFDGDEAGGRAAMRVFPLFLELGYMPRVAVLPRGEDPDSLVRKEGAEALRDVVDRSQSLFEYFVNETVTSTGRDAAGVVKALATLVPLLKAVRDPVAQAVYRDCVAKMLDVPGTLIREAVGGGERAVRALFKDATRSHPIALPSAERLLIELMVQMPDLAPRALKALRPEDLADEFSRTIMALFQKNYELTERVNIGDVLDGLADPEVEQEMRSIAMSSEKVSRDEADQVLSDCIRSIKQRPQRESMRELSELIRIAESRGDEEQLLDLLRRKKELAVERLHETRKP